MLLELEDLGEIIDIGLADLILLKALDIRDTDFPLLSLVLVASHTAPTTSTAPSARRILLDQLRHLILLLAPKHLILLGLGGKGPPVRSWVVAARRLDFLPWTLRVLRALRALRILGTLRVPRRFA